MNLKNLVENLTMAEREELLNILSNDYPVWTTKPPHIKKEILNEKTTEKENKDTEDFTMNSRVKDINKRSVVKARENTWTDSGEDRHIKTPEKPITPRNRKPPKKKGVVCYVCGKQNSINASLIYGEYYRCDNCLGIR